MQYFSAGRANMAKNLSRELESDSSATWESVVYESSHLSRWDEWLEYLEHRGLGHVSHEASKGQNAKCS